MSILMMDSGYVEYVGHEEVSEEDLKKAKMELEKILKVSYNE